MQKIKGQQVVLRPATLNDRWQIYQWLALSNLTPTMLGYPLFPETEVPTWKYFLNDYHPGFFNDLSPDNGRSFIIEVNNQPIGQINYNEIDRNTNTVELDIWLSSRENCHRGLGTDAINSLCYYLAHFLQCQTFILAPSARNLAAIQAYKKCGFQPTQATPANFTPDYPDTVVMAKNLFPTKTASSGIIDQSPEVWTVNALTGKF